MTTVHGGDHEFDDRVLEVLEEDECLALLVGVPIGRLAFTEGSLPAVQPVAFAVSDGEIYIPTHESSKVAAASRGAVVAFVWIGESWWQIFTAAVFAMIFTQIAFLGHDAAHRQIFVSGRWNDWIILVVGDLLVGMSYGWWRHKHTRHHANPNQLGADPDIELPVVAVTPVPARLAERPSWRATSDTDMPGS